MHMIPQSVVIMEINYTLENTFCYTVLPFWSTEHFLYDLCIQFDISGEIGLEDTTSLDKWFATSFHFVPLAQC